VLIRVCTPGDPRYTGGLSGPLARDRKRYLIRFRQVVHVNRLLLLILLVFLSRQFWSAGLALGWGFAFACPRPWAWEEARFFTAAAVWVSYCAPRAGAPTSKGRAQTSAMLRFDNHQFFRCHRLFQSGVRKFLCPSWLKAWARVFSSGACSCWISRVEIDVPATKRVRRPAPFPCFPDQLPHPTSIRKVALSARALIQLADFL